MTAARQVKYVLLQLTFQLFQDPKTLRRSHTSQTQVSSWSKRVKPGGSAALTLHGARAEPFEVNKSPESESETPRAGLHGDPRWVWLLRRKTDKEWQKAGNREPPLLRPLLQKKKLHSCKYVGVCMCGLPFFSFRENGALWLAVGGWDTELSDPEGFLTMKWPSWLIVLPTHQVDQ